MKSEIGSIVHALMFGRIKANDRMRFQRRLSFLCSQPHKVETVFDGHAAQPYPLPLEVELGLPNLTLQQLQTVFRRRYE